MDAAIRTSNIEKAYLYISTSPTRHTGSIHVTARHLVFASADRQKEIWLLLQTLWSIERKSPTPKGTPIVLRTKTYRLITLLIPNEKESNDLYDALTDLGFKSRMEELHAFEYKYSPGAKSKNMSWEFYNAPTEYQRMGVPNSKWRATSLNRRFGLCSTYPRELYVPASCSDEMLTECAAFRSRQRLPILSYIYKNESSLTRCSQPKVGIQSKRSVADEAMVQNIFSANPNKVNKHYIIDARPKVNAMAQRANGAGYESTAFYLNCKYLCMNIENIHVIRESLNKLVDACHVHNATASQWISNVYGSGWLHHIRTILEASNLMARAMAVEGASVVLHCSDGWDRTAQLSSLTQLCLDPYYRTIKGFIGLISKEWVYFGHKFQHRNGFWALDKKEYSPVFTQFLDCVWQLQTQFPCAFEFNWKMLIDLNEELHACRFGSFLGNCERERMAANLSESTPSLWYYLIDNSDKYINPIYSIVQEVLVAETAPQHIHVFKGLYCQYLAGKIASAVKDTYPEDLAKQLNGDDYQERRNYIISMLNQIKEKDAGTTASLSLFDFDSKSDQPNPEVAS